MKQNQKKLKMDFNENGFVVIKKLFSSKECRKYRQLINAHFNLPSYETTQRDINFKTFLEADGVTKNKNFWSLIFKKELLNIVKNLIGKEICYTQHSDLHINLAAGKYHRDNAHRGFKIGPDWNESLHRYKVVRVAIYLSDYKTSGSSLVVFPQSNKQMSLVSKYELAFWNFVRLKWSNLFSKNSLPHIFFSKRMKKIKNSEGDCIIFDQRILHAGGTVKGIYPKYASYLSFGAKNNIHTTNHHNFYLSRPTYLKKIPNDLKKKLKKNEILYKND